MSNPRGYTRGTITALAVLGRGTCYWPDPPCTVPATVLVGNRHVFNLEIAHICAANKGGPRYVENMTNDQRRAFNNLIFLCTPHHLVIDKIEPDTYQIATLRQWKANREKGDTAGLDRVPELTEDHIQVDVGQAIGQQIREVRVAIDQLAGINLEAANLLREIADRLDRPTLNLDILEQFTSAAAMLAPTLDEGNVNHLYRAAVILSEASNRVDG